MRLFALRGAVSVERNDAQRDPRRDDELMREIMERNALAPEHVVSCIFTATDDLDAEFPAVAARALGFESVPLLCAREIAVPGLDAARDPRADPLLRPGGPRPAHVYLGEASALRADLAARAAGRALGAAQ